MNTLYSQMMGDDHPVPGTLAVQPTLLSSLHARGSCSSTLSPLLWGPRNWGQSASTVLAQSTKLRLKEIVVRIMPGCSVSGADQGFSVPSFRQTTSLINRSVTGIELLGNAVPWIATTCQRAVLTGNSRISALSGTDPPNMQR